MPHRRSILILALLAAAGPLHAQPHDERPPPVVWDAIPDDQLRMTAYPPDTAAAALVLADYGTVYFSSNFFLIFERHRRIKILAEAGYDWGTVAIPYYASGRDQRVTRIQGQTVTRSPDGGVQRHRLDDASIFTEDVDEDWRQVRFTLPALQPGAVIEYRYTVESRYPSMLDEWTFQDGEPTLHSEFRATIPAGFFYLITQRGRLNLTVKEEEVVPQQHARYRWVMQDVPAIRREPFMTTPKNYRAAVAFQLREVAHPAFRKATYMQTWEETAAELMGMATFGRQLKPTRRVRQLAASHTDGLADPLEKLRALYRYVSSTIAWDERRGLVAEHALDEILTRQQASSPESALLLTALLRAAGVEADPVLISTREHGDVIEGYPMLGQFNSVIVQARIGDDAYLLDATDPLRPYGLLPPEALNGRGWLVDKKAPRWIAIDRTGRYLSSATVTADLDPDGTLHGTLQTTDAEYGALERRHALSAAPEGSTFVRDVLFEGHPQVTIGSVGVVHREEVAEPLEVTATFTLPGHAQALGDRIYFEPILTGRFTETPLRSPTRTFPVDMVYPAATTYTLRLRIPEGYTVEAVPHDFRIQLPLGGGHFVRGVTAEDGVVTVQRQLLFSRAVFPADVYQDLRAFFARVVAAEADQVVLRRLGEGDTGGHR